MTKRVREHLWVCCCDGNFLGGDVGMDVIGKHIGRETLEIVVLQAHTVEPVNLIVYLR